MDQGAAAERDGTVAIFAYGTLKQGFQNHAAYCRGLLDVRPVRTWGRLYRWRPGIPILQVPEECVLLVGSTDPAADLSAARDLDAPPSQKMRKPAGLQRWRKVRGEMLVFPDAVPRLVLLDAFEGFHPHTGRRQYERVLVPVELEDGEPRTTQAWTYVLPFDREPPSERIRGDVWEPGMG